MYVRTYVLTYLLTYLRTYLLRNRRETAPRPTTPSHTSRQRWRLPRTREESEWS